MQENTVQSGAYVTKTDLTDAGPFVTGLMLTLPEPVFQGAVRPDTFSVFVRRCDRHTGEIIRLSKKAFSAEALKEAADGASQGWRSVSAAYPCDEQGRAVYASDKVMLEMPYGPLEPLSSRAARKNAMQNDFVDMQIRVTQIAPIPGAPACQGLVFDRCAGDLCPAFNGWQFSEAVTQKTPLRYAWYAPEQAAGEKRPLLIWLHGAGGGGADPRYPVAGNRVTAFSSQPAQKKLGSPWVYVPQCPTVWMDDGKGSPLMQSNNSVYIDCLKQAIERLSPSTRHPSTAAGSGWRGLPTAALWR